MDRRGKDMPSVDSLKTLLGIIAPGSLFIAIKPLEGDFSNSTHLVEARGSDGSPVRLVTRQYAIFGNYDRGEKARREFKALQFLHQHGSPVPEPVYIDDSGAVLGSPGIVTRYVPGRLIMTPPYPTHWAETLARTLVSIHATLVDPAEAPFLLDANREALWFLRSRESIPDYISVHPKGTLL